MSWESWLLREGFDVRRIETNSVEFYRGFAEAIGIVAKNRRRRIVWLRYFFWRDAKDELKASLEFAGLLTGGHDHATVLNGMKNLRIAAETKDAISIHFKEEYKELKKKYTERIKNRNDGKE